MLDTQSEGYDQDRRARDAYDEVRDASLYTTREDAKACFRLLEQEGLSIKLPDVIYKRLSAIIKMQEEAKIRFAASKKKQREAWENREVLSEEEAYAENMKLEFG